MGRKRQTVKAEQMYQMYEQGYSLEQIGQIWGVTRQSVFDMFRRRGWELRKKKELPVVVFNDAKYTLDNHGYYRRTDGNRNWLHQDVWEFSNGPVPQGYEIHHKDQNKINNDIANLECLTPTEHAAKHHFFQEIPEKRCLFCGKLLERKTQPSGKLETPAEVARRRYCDMRCASEHKRGKPAGWSPTHDK